MTPGSFPEETVVLGKDQPEYLPLCAHVSDDQTQTVTTCWDLNDVDIAAIIKHRKIWVQQLTFGQPLQPQRVTAFKPVLSKNGRKVNA